MKRLFYIIAILVACSCSKELSFDHADEVDNNDTIVTYKLKDDYFCIYNGVVLKLMAESNPCVWSTGDTASYLIVSKPGTYLATYKYHTSNGQVTSEVDTFRCQYCDYTISIANTFSPNGDGQNDILRVYGFGIINLTAVIFNADNKEVFRSSDIYFSWDGRLDGKPLPVGTYYYIIKVKYKDNSIKEYPGEIKLIK